MHKFTVESWHAVHSSGTKFYQVMTIKMSDGDKSLGSFALRQNGAIGVSNGPGKMTTGAVEGIEADLIGPSAGVAKMTEKRAGGYTSKEQEFRKEFSSLGDLRIWINSNIGPKGERYCRETIRNVLKWADIVALQPRNDPETESTPRPRHEPDEPAAAKHTDWGSW